MLRKLLKYDIENINKILVIFYILALIFAGLTRIFLSIDDSFIMSVIGKVCSGATIAMVFNIIINNVMRLWVRFKNNFYNDEAYLTHTLPVDKKTLYLSKSLSSIITLFSSMLVICLALFIAYYSKENILFLKKLLLPLATVYDSTIVSIILMFVFVLFLEIMNMLQAGYTGIITGHMQNSNKFFCSIVFGFVTYSLTQIFTVILIFLVALFNKDIMNLFYTTDALSISTIKSCIFLAIVIYTLNIFILYFVNTRLFNKGVNVD